MELVYLWVEDYKNIQKQGFNFSPRFECEFKDEYDEEGRLKDDCELKINKKDEYVNIFPEKINVTAIVGENGSGKSSIFKLVLMLIFYKKYKDISRYEYEITTLNKEIKNKSLFLIINTSNGCKSISLNTNVDSTKDLIELNDKNLDFFSIYFSYMLDTLQNKNDYWMWNLYHKSDGYTTPILLTPNKFQKKFLQNSINLDDIEYINIKHSIKFYKKEIDTKINKFFTPNRIKLYTDNPSYVEGIEYVFFGKVAGKFLELSNKDKIRYNEEKIIFILKKIKDIETNRDYKKINLLYIAFKMLSSSEGNFNASTYQKIDKWFKADLNDSFIKLINDNIANIFENEIIKYDNEKINDCIEFHNNSPIPKNEILNKLLDRKVIELVDFEDISIILVPWIDLELLEDEKSFNSLSGGQKLFFTFMVNMMYEVSNLIDEEDYKTINLFLDEVEVGYHPSWQKEFVYNMMEALKKINLKNKKINLFFASHSPFILSDIPKENVIFLKDGKQVEVDINSFGANIHTLLSHGFFMQDGLMGEFAKNKIEDVLNYLNDKESSIKDNDEAQKLLNIIGEPVIKNQLQKMLDSKRLSKVDEVNQQIKDMEYDLRVLKQNQNKYIRDELNDRAKKRYKQGKDDDK